MWPLQLARPCLLVAGPARAASGPTAAGAGHAARGGGGGGLRERHCLAAGAPSSPLLCALPLSLSLPYCCSACMRPGEGRARLAGPFVAHMHARVLQLWPCNGVINSGGSALRFGCLRAHKSALEIETIVGGVHERQSLHDAN